MKFDPYLKNIFYLPIRKKYNQKIEKMWNVIFSIFTYFKCWLRSEKWQADLSSYPSHTYQNWTLAAKSFEKNDKNVKYHFFSFSPTLNAG